jgi:hypothetical protein
MKDKTTIRISDKTRIAIKADGSRIPVIDSKYSFIVQPEEEDKIGAIPLSPTECMYCNACKRQFGSELVFVTRGLAYIELKNKLGKPELWRFILTKPAVENIHEFDARGQLTQEAVVFAAPKGARRLDYQRQAYQQKVKSEPRPALVKGILKGSKPKEKVGHLMAEKLRDKQTGRFQFLHTK